MTPTSSEHVRRAASRLGAAALLLALAACSVPLGPPVATAQNVTAVRAQRLPPMALGTFSLAPGRDASLDQSVSMRTTFLRSPYAGSFSAYLKESMATDLRAAGLLDPQAPVVIDAQLTENQLSVPSGVARASLGARFGVKRAGVPVYDKELRASSEWSAGFVGIEALPNALNVYEQLYRKLTRTLLEDPDFRSAVTQ
jgi:hypothetical protein